MQRTLRVEPGLTKSTPAGSIAILPKSQLLLAIPTQHHQLLLQLIFPPSLGLMPSHLVMALETRKVEPTALELDGDNVNVTMVVGASCEGIYNSAVDGDHGRRSSSEAVVMEIAMTLSHPRQAVVEVDSEKEKDAYIGRFIKEIIV